MERLYPQSWGICAENFGKSQMSVYSTICGLYEAINKLKIINS